MANYILGNQGETGIRERQGEGERGRERGGGREGERGRERGREGEGERGYPKNFTYWY